MPGMDDTDVQPVRIETDERAVMALLEHVVRRDRRLGLLQVEHDRLTRQLAQSEQALNQATQKLVEREQALQQLQRLQTDSARNEALAARDRDCAPFELELRELRATLQDKERAVVRLQDQERALRESTTWKLLEPLRRVRRRIAPPLTRRERLFRLTVRVGMAWRCEGLGYVARRGTSKVLARLRSSRLVSFLLPYGTRRRRTCGLLLRLIRLLVTEGLRGALTVYRSRPNCHVAEGETLCGGLPAQRPSLGESSSMDVIVFPIIEWTHRFQRPQQIATQYALHGHRVFYLSFEPCGLDSGPTWRQVRENIFELHLPGLQGVDHFTERMSAAALAEAAAGLEAFRCEARIHEAICIVQLPFWGALASALRAQHGWRVVYECMDELEGLAILRAEMLQDETELATGADMVITTATRLLQKHTGNNANTLLVHNGCDYEHFSKRSSCRELRQVKRPIIGYVGAIMEWFDDEVVRTIAKSRPEWSIVLVGRVDSPAVRELGNLTNVQLLGEQPYDRIPAFLGAFDVCLIPFRLSPITLSTDPVKFYEYLCAGKPVVSSPLPELMQYGELFYPASSGAEFVSQIERALQESNADRTRRRIAWARGQTWEARYDAIDHATQELYPMASIVIVSYNGLSDITQCLRSIIAETIYPNYEVIVVDNGSEAGVVKSLIRLVDQDPRIRIVANATNEGFARAVNKGIRNASAESKFVVLLNNDTVVVRGWLCGLLRWLRDPAVGMVGPVTCPSGAANEAAVPVSYTDLDEMEEVAWEYTRARTGQYLEPDMLAMFCVAMRREVYEKVGPLDEQFGIGMFEDDDYAIRMRRAGYRLLCVDDVFIHHKGRASFSLLDSNSYDRAFAENRNRFEAKWNTEWKAPSGR